ncbi:MAG: acetylglutamate kinase [Firmicutes bacterium]|nr:acetylglutamate kinase [Bacillota bacterium]
MKKDIEKVVEKAAVLTEALPYIRDFHDKIVVVKLGRSVLKDKDLVDSVLDDIVLLKLIGAKPVIVHSGSDEINRWLKNIGKEIEFVDGKRVTDEQTMEIVEMVLGKINKDIVQELSKRQTKAVGICGKDSDTIIARAKTLEGTDLGFFGEVVSINTELVSEMIERGFTPVIASIGVSKDYKAYNITADDVATEVAKALKAEKVVLLSTEEGIDTSLNAMLPVTEAKYLLNNVNEQMSLKLRSAIDAVENGVKRAHIVFGGIKHGLLLELFTVYGVGTAVVGDDITLYNHESEYRGKRR